MTDYQFTRIVTKPITIQQEQKETVVLPVLDLTGPVVVEVLNDGKGTVIINGVIFKGASLVDVRTTRNSYTMKTEGSVQCQTPRGRLELPVTDFVITKGFEPTTVEWKVERPEGICCVLYCGLETIIRSSFGERLYYCSQHFGQLHPSRR